jgi:hypothetical protein
MVRALSNPASATSGIVSSGVLAERYAIASSGFTHVASRTATAGAGFGIGVEVL